MLFAKVSALLALFSTMAIATYIYTCISKLCAIVCYTFFYVIYLFKFRAKTSLPPPPLWPTRLQIAHKLSIPTTAKCRGALNSRQHNYIIIIIGNPS